MKYDDDKAINNNHKTKQIINPDSILQTFNNEK